jgi:precorrin-3B methylase
MSCDYSPYVGYNAARLQTLIAQAESAFEQFSLGKTVQRVAMGDMSVGFANATLTLSALQKTLAALRAALKAAQAAADGLVPEMPQTVRRPVFPWIS